jgi:hypothetical protein
LEVNAFISFCTKNKFKVAVKNYEVEEFIFQYQKRKNPEEKIIEHICSNFLNFSRGCRLQERWNLLSIIGGRGVGKSRISYEIWNILKDFVQNQETLCTQWLDNDKEIFFKFKERILGNNLIEVFAKEGNEDSLKVDEEIVFHVGCSLATCLFKNNEREIVSIADIKKLANDKGMVAQFSNIDFIMACLREFYGGSPLTIIWRWDEIQKVEIDKECPKRESNVCNYIWELIKLTSTYTAGNFIIPIITGTTNIIIEQYIPSSTFQIAKVPLFISDFSVDDALRMINEKILVKKTDHEFRRLVEALGPIPKLIQFLVNYLIEANGKYTIPEIYNFICDQVTVFYRIDNWKDQQFNATLILSTLEKWNEQEYLSISPRIEDFIRDGVLFTTKTDHLFLPIVFVKILFKSIHGFDQQHLIRYLDAGISKKLEYLDLETFPVWFYAFKVFLYLQLGIKSVIFEKFFHGAFMNEVTKVYLIL